uniref:NADH-ubiquinone oxidoreductase chain 2 n=1 Tax=Auchenoplax crinita TaxID=397536 RepID=G8XXK7_AUCCR|nr:NADH dehydrogenase subunit 2 [Auchenoplax crinita]
MISIVWKPYSVFMLMILVFGLVISLSCDNWLAIWVGLEINLYSFIPIILLNNKNSEKEAAIKYFIAQSVPSAVMIVSFVSDMASSVDFSSLLFISLAMKMGVAPMHFWLPSVMSAVTWWVCWVISTVQKIGPMMIVLYAGSFSCLMVSYCAALSAIIGGLGGVNQTMFRVLLAYSSIGHMGWIVAGSMISSVSASFYFFTYMMLISSIFFYLDKMKFSSGDMMVKMGSSSQVVLLLMFMFFSLGGLPPLFGFYPKMMLLSSFIDFNFMILSGILIFGSVVNIYYYLKMVFIGVLSSSVSIFSLVEFKKSWSLFMGFMLTVSMVMGVMMLNFIYI